MQISQDLELLRKRKDCRVFRSRPFGGHAPVSTGSVSSWNPLPALHSLPPLRLTPLCCSSEALLSTGPLYHSHSRPVLLHRSCRMHGCFPRSLRVCLNSWAIVSTFPSHPVYAKSEFQGPFLTLALGVSFTLWLNCPHFSHVTLLSRTQHPSRQSQASLLWWSFFPTLLVNVGRSPCRSSTLFMSLQCLPMSSALIYVSLS